MIAGAPCGPAAGLVPPTSLVCIPEPSRSWHQARGLGFTTREAPPLAVAGGGAEAAAWAEAAAPPGLADAERLLRAREPALYREYQVGRRAELS
jgi:hypothetical protein